MGRDPLIKGVAKKGGWNLAAFHHFNGGAEAAVPERRVHVRHVVVPLNHLDTTRQTINISLPLNLRVVPD